MAQASTLSTRKKKMLEALIKTRGIVTYAADNAGIDRTTHYVWCEQDPDYKKKVEDIAEIALDAAENSLHGQIDEKNTAATIFYLKTKGKKRGYIEKQEIGFTDPDGNAMQILFKPSQDEPLK